MRARTSRRACSAEWASRSSRPPAGWSHRGQQSRRESAAKSCATCGEERMSRIGKRPVEVPAGVTVSIDPGRVMVNGTLGTLQQQVPARMKIEQSDGELLVTRPTERGEDRALPGLTRTLVAN